MHLALSLQGERAVRGAHKRRRQRRGLHRHRRKQRRLRARLLWRLLSSVRVGHRCRWCRGRQMAVARRQCEGQRRRGVFRAERLTGAGRARPRVPRRPSEPRRWRPWFRRGWRRTDRLPIGHRYIQGDVGLNELCRRAHVLSGDLEAHMPLVAGAHPRPELRRDHRTLRGSGNTHCRIGRLHNCCTGSRAVFQAHTIRHEACGAVSCTPHQGCQLITMTKVVS